MSAPLGHTAGTRDTAAAAWLAGLRETYAGRRPGSAELAARAAAVLPGGNSRTPLHHEPFPTYIARGAGAEVTDVDGHVYLDLVNNYTSLVHGHPDDELAARLAEQAAAGTAYGAPTPAEVELAEVLVNRIGSLERVRFVNSGTEATLYAVRTARAFTGRDAVIKVEGGYHGGAESLQISVKSLGENGRPVSEAGVPDVLAAQTHVIPFNDVAGAEDLVRRHAAQAAALIVEPVQGGAGSLPADHDYLVMLRRLTAEQGCLLVFDEVMSLRLAAGGMQQVYGVEPDLTALGKIIGGGLPVGAFGGRADVVDLWAPTALQPRYHAGTFNANPLTMVAGLDALRRLTPQAIARINARGDLLRAEFNRMADEHGLSLVASGWGSVLQVHEGREPPVSFRDARSRGRELVRGLHLLLLEEGVFTAPRGAMNISTALDEEQFARVLAACETSLDAIARAQLG